MFLLYESEDKSIKLLFVQALVLTGLSPKLSFDIILHPLTLLTLHQKKDAGVAESCLTTPSLKYNYPNSASNL